MKKSVLWVVILLMTLPSVLAQEKAKKVFPQYTWIEVGASSSMTANFGYLKNSFTVVNKRCDALPQTDPCYMQDNSLEWVLVGRYKNSSMSESVNILFSPGPSVDPEFQITDVRNNIIWNYIAEEMCINDTGIFYTAGNIDKMFDERAKWHLYNGMVREVKQPYLYVGVKGELLKPVRLYSHKTGGEVVATLPKGYEIEILLSESNDDVSGTDFFGMPKNYLARSAFGLVGWLRLAPEDMSMFDPVVRGLGYMGD